MKNEFIKIEAPVEEIAGRKIVRIPPEISRELPSRGIAAVELRLNESCFYAVAEPDGKGSHWLELPRSGKGETVSLEIRSTEHWPEPVLPEDIKKMLSSSDDLWKLWNAITPLARHDWIRWIRSSKTLQTRENRIEAARDKMEKGERRPCCFNRSLCSFPDVCIRGILQ